MPRRKEIQVLDGDGTGEVYRPDQKVDAPAFNRTGHSSMTVDGTRYWWRRTELGGTEVLRFSYYDKAMLMALSAGRFLAEWTHMFADWVEKTNAVWRFTIHTKGDMAAFIRQHVKQRTYPERTK